MQPSEESSKVSGRPSLLSSDDPPDSSAPRILGTLDDASGRPMAGGARGKRIHFGRLAISVAVIAAIAGASAWWGAHTHKVVVLASTVPSSPGPVSATVSATAGAGAPAGPDAGQVSTAAILHDVPDARKVPAATEDDAHALFAVKAGPAVKRPALVMLAPATPPAVPGPAAHIAKPAVKEADPGRRPVAVPAKRAQPAKAVPEEQDSDVTLLAALVAHSKANEPKHSTTAAKLKQCATLASVAQAESCRAKLCAGSVNLEECRGAPVAKAADEA